MSDSINQLIPDNWLQVKLYTIATLIRGVTYKKDDAISYVADGYLPLLRATNITGNSLTFTDLVFIPQKCVSVDQIIVFGDIVIASSSGSKEIVGKSGQSLNTSFCGSFGAFCTGIRPSSKIFNLYLGYYFQTPNYRQKISDLSAGSNINNIKSSELSEHLIPLAPLAEQTRIVEKLEELLSDLDAGVAELKAAQKKLGQYRQSLLKAAVEGALTADWRKLRQAASPQPLPHAGGGAKTATSTATPAHHNADFAPLSPRGRGAGGEGEATPNPAWLAARAKTLRQGQTPQEHRLWQQLRAKRFSGFKFRRQQVLGRYFVDFVCLEKRLIVEVDGGQHSDASGYDGQRDAWLQEQGFRVLRVWNNEVNAQAESVMEAIWQALQQEPPLPNPSPTRGEGLEDETGAQLLQRILLERRARWEAKQLAKFAELGKPAPTDWQKKYPEPVQPDVSGLPELPVGWVWASLDQMFFELRSGSAETTTRVQTSYPVLKSSAVRQGIISFDALNFLNEQQTRSENYLQLGDILITRLSGSVEFVGCCAMVNSLPLTGVQYPDRVFCGKLIPSMLLYGEYLTYCIRSAYGRKRIEIAAKSTAGHKRISISDLHPFPIPLPPNSEIHEICTKVLDGLQQMEEATLATSRSLKQATAQRKNILKAAFSGQLVPQDPSDEPASVLLERIRAERAALAAVKQPQVRKAKEVKP